MDVLTAATYFKERPEWANAKVGHIGESMGETTAMNLMRPYLRRAFNDLYGKPPAQLDAAGALYAGCTERNTAEAFLPIPLFDAPYRWARWRVENPAKCANVRDGGTYTLEVNGATYPGTSEGYAQMRKDCIAMTRSGVVSGNKGDPKTGYGEWTAFFKKHLLE